MRLIFGRSAVRLAFLSCTLLLSFAFVGCGASHAIKSGQLDALDMRLTLPDGKWLVAAEGDNFVHVMNEAKTANFLVVRVPRQGGPPLVGLQIFGLDLPDATLVKIVVFESRIAGPVALGTYDVLLDGERFFIEAHSFNYGNWTYDLAQWGSDAPRAVNWPFNNMSLSAVRPLEEK